MKYKTEHKKLIEYLQGLDLQHHIPDLQSKEVVVLMDSGYDNKKLQKKILSLG